MAGGTGSRVGPPLRRRVGPQVVELYSGTARRGWQNLLELVMLSLIWFFMVFSSVLAVEVPTILAKGGGILLALIAVLIPVSLVGPATVGIFTAADLIWSGEAIGPFDALRNFFRGFRRHYLRAVGLGVLWGLVLVALYANTVEDRRFIPPLLNDGIGILLLYILLFVVMINVYLISILAITDWNLVRAIRVAAWEAIANPLFTLSALLVPGAVVVLGSVLRPLLALLVGGALALLSTGALRFAPLRHPELPVPHTVDEPLPDDVLDQPSLEVQPGPDDQGPGPERRGGAPGRRGR